MNKNTTISIDLAKEIFQVAIFSSHGKMLVNKKLSASKMKELIAQYPNATIVMEACGTAHHWGRFFIQREYQVKLVPAQIAAKYRIGNKNDSNDAIAIYEASKNPKIHFVSIRTLEQQDIATLHKFREGLKKEQNQISNRIRGFALEYGEKFPLSIKALLKRLPEALENADNQLTSTARTLLEQLQKQLRETMKRLDAATKAIVNYVKAIEPCKRLTELPGFGWLVASAVYAKLGSGEAFKRGRDASASLGLAPAHSGSGGKLIIGKITRRGDAYVRSMVIHGARAIVILARKKTNGLSLWIQKLLESKSFNTTVVAVANKLVRMALAMLKTGQSYKPVTLTA